MKRFEVRVTESRRESIAQGAALAGALLIVISLFLPWYSIGLSDSAKDLAEIGVQEELDAADVDTEEIDAASELIDTSVNFSGWSSLELADALLLFVAVAAALFVMRRRKSDSSAVPREGDDWLMQLGLLSVVVVLVLLFTKNSPLGMLSSTVDFAQDKASDLGVPGAQLEFLAISPGIGLWIGLIGSLLTLAAGVFHSLVDPVGASAPAPAAATPASAGTAETTPGTAETQVSPGPSEQGPGTPP